MLSQKKNNSMVILAIYAISIKHSKSDNCSFFSSKALRLSGPAKKKTKDGEILNLMSVDAKKIQVKRFINMKYKVNR